jgi:hypothetical protein
MYNTYIYIYNIEIDSLSLPLSIDINIDYYHLLSLLSSWLDYHHYIILLLSPVIPADYHRITANITIDLTIKNHKNYY